MLSIPFPLTGASFPGAAGRDGTRESCPWRRRPDTERGGHEVRKVPEVLGRVNLARTMERPADARACDTPTAGQNAARNWTRATSSW